jgi:hypothetical protein
MTCEHGRIAQGLVLVAYLVELGAEAARAGVECAREYDISSIPCCSAEEPRVLRQPVGLGRWGRGEVFSCVFGRLLGSINGVAIGLTAVASSGQSRHLPVIRRALFAYGDDLI